MVEQSSLAHIINDDADTTLQQIQLILTAAQCCLLTMDADGIILTISDGITAITGYAPQDLIGTSYYDLLHDEQREELQRNRHNGHQQTYEMPLKTVNGSQRWVRQTCIPHKVNKTVTYQCLLQDISSEKETEAQLASERNLLRILVDAIPDAIQAKDPDNRYVLSNNAHAQLLGFDSPDEIVGKTGDEILPPAMADRFREEDDAVMNGDLSIQNEERTAPDGTILSASKYALRDADGTTFGVMGIARDVTSEKEHEAQLRQRENLYRLLARNLPNTAVFLYDTDMRILIAEGPELERVGIVAADIEGKSFDQVLSTMSEQTYEQLQLYFDTLKGNEHIFEREYYGGIHFRIHAIPVYDDDNEIIGGLALATNIHEQKTREQALADSEARNRALLNALPDTMVVMRANGAINEIHSTDWLQGVDIQHIDDFDVSDAIKKQILQTVRKTLNSEDIQQDEIEVEYEGHHTTFDVRMVALNTQEVLILSRDISMLKKTQHELQDHLNDMELLQQVNNELLQTFDFKAVVNMALDVSLRLIGAHAGYVAIRNEDQSLSVSTMIGDYSVRTVNKVINRKRKGIVPRVLRNLQAEMIHQPQTDPAYIPLLDSTQDLMVIPLISNERAIGVLQLESHIDNRFDDRDFQLLQLITSRIAAFIDNANLYQKTQQQLAELQELYDEVSELEALKTDMIRIASHDLKNPLMGLMSSVEFIYADDSLSDMTKKYVGHIRKAGKEMLNITRSILSLERIEQMAKNQSLDTLNFTDFVATIVREQGMYAEQKQQTVHDDITTEALYVAGDKYQLHEALVNLMTNAVKYTPDGGDIYVRLRRVDGDRVQVRVRDTGYGIPADQQARLFSPFYRAKSDATANIDGTGLGLHLVKNIIERHGGTVYFESVEGEGSTFGFDLPLSDDNTPNEGITGAYVIR